MYYIKVKNTFKTNKEIKFNNKAYTINPNSSIILDDEYLDDFKEEIYKLLKKGFEVSKVDINTDNIKASEKIRNTSNEEVEQPVKRKRGRPKKNTT